MFKKLVIILSMVTIIITGVIVQQPVSAEEVQNKRVILKVNDASMFIDDADTGTFIDPATYTTPVIINNRVLLPISNVIQEFGGTVTWEPKQKQVTITLNANEVSLFLNKKIAYVNGNKINLDVAPTTISGKTMVPLRFVSDHLGLQLIWDSKNEIIALYQGQFDSIPTDYSNYFIYNSDNQEDETTIDNNNENETKNSNKPISKDGVKIKEGDRVQFSFFYGEVEKVDGGRILVYWDSKDNMWVQDKDVDYWAMLAGIRYKSSSWIDASDLTVEK